MNALLKPPPPAPGPLYTALREAMATHLAGLRGEPSPVDPLLEGLPKAQRRWEELQERPTWSLMLALCDGSPDYGSALAPPIADHLLEEDEDEEEESSGENENEDEGESEDATGKSAPGAGEHEGKPEEKPDDAGEADEPDITPEDVGPPDPEKQERNAGADALLGKLVEGLTEIRAGLDQVCVGLGGGTDPELGPQIRDGRRLDLARRIEQNPKLKQILDLAGRVSSTAWQPRTVPSDLAREEIVEVEHGADLSRILASQLAGLRHPLLRRKFFRDFAERGLLQYQMRGWEHVQRGGIVLLLDQSGSMGMGTPLRIDRMGVATAVAIGSMRIAQAQKRAISMGGFSTSLLWRWTGSTAKEFLDQVEFLVRQQPYGGTVVNEALSWGIDQAVRTSADLVLLTDGEIGACSEIERLARARQAHGLRVITLLMGDAQSPAVRQISDQTYHVDRQGEGEHYGAFLAQPQR